jgi:hypothetical protein
MPQNARDRAIPADHAPMVTMDDGNDSFGRIRTEYGRERFTGSASPANESHNVSS